MNNLRDGAAVFGGLDEGERDSRPADVLIRDALRLAVDAANRRGWNTKSDEVERIRKEAQQASRTARLGLLSLKRGNMLEAIKALESAQYHLGVCDEIYRRNRKRG